MNSKSAPGHRSACLVLGIVAFGASAGSGALASTPEPEGSEVAAAAGSGQSCVVDHVPVGSTTEDGYTEIETQMSEATCYETLRAAVASTGGEVPAGTAPEDITNAMVNPEYAGVSSKVDDGDPDLPEDAQASRIVIGIWWRQPSFDGGDIVQTTQDRCTRSRSFRSPEIVGSWNDSISSAKGYGGCNRWRFFEHAGYAGASRLCDPNCGDLGVMNNEASSWKSRNKNWRT